MRVTYDNQTVFVGWRYDNPELEEMLARLAMSRESVKGLNEPDLIKEMNKRLSGGLTIVSIPKPTVTTCIISREDKSVVAEASVKKHANDPYDKDKARRYSLGKVLLENFPGEGNKELRKTFWMNYITRNVKAPIEMKAV